MDKYRPKRPTTLALFPQQPPAGTQDSINNNSLGKKDSWKDSHSSSPHITGDLTPTDAQPKAEDKVRPNSQRRPAPKPPTAPGPNGKANTTDIRARARDRAASSATQSSGSPRSQRKAGGVGGGGGRGAGRGATTMRERSLVELRGKDGAPERRGGRLCEDSRTKDKERNGHLKAREALETKGRAAEGRGKGGLKGGNKAGGYKANNALANQKVYLPAMVVPRTPVAPRNQDKTQKTQKTQKSQETHENQASQDSQYTQDQGQNHDRSQDNPPVLSRSSSEGGSNRMSLSSDTEGPPPGPLHPSLSQRTNPDISEEDGEGDPTPCMNGQNGQIWAGPAEPDLIRAEEDNTSEDSGSNIAMDCGAPQTEPQNTVAMNCGGPRTEPQREAAAGLSYDHVKYTLVVDEDAQLELVNLKDCLHGYNQHNDDSDSDTVYQSANEDEDPEYKEERKRTEEERNQERRRKEKERKKEEELRKRREEDLRRRREEEVKRRREVVTRVFKQPKVTSTTTSEEDESNGGRAGAPRTKKFLNLFANDGSEYSATGAGSFGMFSCVLNGVERQQSHRAAYRFVPRHADELYLEMDDPVLILTQSADLWCQGYNMRTGATGIFPAYYASRVSKETQQIQKVGWTDQFLVRFLGSVQVPIHTGNDVLCAAMHKVACNRRSAGQPPSSCVLEVSMKGVKLSVQDQCQSAHRGDQCFHFFHLKNISFCGCHPKHSRYFGFITKHPDQTRFACHVLMSDTTLHPLAESVGRAFQQYYKEHIGYSCPTEDIFIE